MITQTINLDLIPGGVKPVAYVNQYDQQPAALVCRLYNGGSAFNVPAGASVVIEGTKPDKTAFVYAAASVSGQDVTINCDQQMTAVAGDVDCELRVRLASGDDTEIIGTLNFILRVEPAAVSDDSVISETMIPLIEQAVDIAANLQEYIDDTLEAAQTATEAAETATAAATSASIVDANVTQIYGSIETAKQNANTAAAAANAAAAVLDGLTAEATTLAAGESATGSYEDGVLTLGIPRGATGESGVVTPINSLFSLAVDPNGDLYAYSNYAEIDEMWEYNALSGDLYYVTPGGRTVTLSGSYITFNSGTDSYRFDRIDLVIGPTQNLNGYASPWAGGAGKNKLVPPNDSPYSNHDVVDMTYYGDGTAYFKGQATTNFPIGFTLVRNVSISGARDGDRFILSGIPANVNSGAGSVYAQLEYTPYRPAIIKDTGNGVEFEYHIGDVMRLGVYFDGEVDVDFTYRPMIRPASDQNSQYAPYENICPIVTYDSGSVTLSPTDQISDGIVYGVTLPESSAAAIFDFVTGVGFITWEHIGTYDPADDDMTEYLETHEWRSDRDEYSAGSVPTSGADVWAVSDDPTRFERTASGAKTLVGDNYMWASTGATMTVDYMVFD